MKNNLLIESLSGRHKQPYYNVAVAFLPPKNWRRERFPILNSVPPSFPQTVRVLFHALQRNKIHYISDFTSREEYFPLWTQQLHVLLITGTAKDWNLWILPSTHGHGFCFIGSLDQAPWVLEETEKVNSGLEMVEKF